MRLLKLNDNETAILKTEVERDTVQVEIICILHHTSPIDISLCPEDSYREGIEEEILEAMLNES
jgi:hypothetical protein